MITRGALRMYAKTLLDRCDAPAVHYKVRKDILCEPYDSLCGLRGQFLSSDIVRQLDGEQREDGSWGRFYAKDYSLKCRFPTTHVAVTRALYIGMDARDDTLAFALEYLTDAASGKLPLIPHEKNERAPYVVEAALAELIERVSPHHPFVDRVWGMWAGIAAAAFADGRYDYERDAYAQHHALGTREKRLVPLPLPLLLTRVAELPAELEQALLDHYWARQNEQGFFWGEARLDRLPDSFYYEKTSRWLKTIHHINAFNHTARYLGPVIEWLIDARGEDGLWDYGPQIRDPWGYFQYFFLNHRVINRKIDCSVEILIILKRFLDANEV